MSDILYAIALINDICMIQQISFASFTPEAEDENIDYRSHMYQHKAHTQLPHSESPFVSLGIALWSPPHMHYDKES